MIGLVPFSANSVIGYYPDSITGCWIWAGSIDRAGYGRVSQNRTNQLAHRIYWQRIHGAIPSTQQLDHLCRVRRCVNPSHLEPVTQKVNILRGYGAPAVNARKTTCIHGHSLEIGAPTVHKKRRSDGTLERVCRICVYQRNKQAWQQVLRSRR